MLFHDLVDKQQQRLLSQDGSLKLSEDESVNLQVADVLIRQVDQLQEDIESDSLLAGQEKVKSLKSLETLLKGYNRYRNGKDFPATVAPALLAAFKEGMELDRKGRSIEPVIRQHNYNIGRILIDCFTFPTENPGVAPSRVLVMEKYLEANPEEILPELKKNPYLPFTDKFIRVAAQHDIGKLYDYAAARNVLASRIRNH